MTKILSASFLLSAAALIGIGHAQSGVDERQVEPFFKLRVENGIDVYLTRADREAVRIEADGIDFDDIVTEVVDDELRIRRAGIRPGVFGSGRVTVHLDFVRLSAIGVSGGSDVESRSTIEVEELDVAASGGSDVEVYGDPDDRTVDVGRSSDVSWR